MPHSQIGVIERSTGRALPAAPAGAVLRSSAGLGWQGLAVELHRLGPSEMPEHIIDQHRLLIHVGQPVLFEWQEGGRWRSTRLHPGSFNLQGHGEVNRPRWHESLEILAVAVEPRFLASLLGDSHTADEIAFATQRGASDPVVARFAHLFREELTAPQFAGALFGETLAMAFSLHLIGRYSPPDRRVREPRGRLTGPQLQRVIDYLYANLAEDVGIEALAGEAYLSPFHFARQFKTTTGLSPHQFVLQLRVAHAQHLIRSSRDLTLTEVGAACGFFDQAHFTKSFKRMVGATPVAFARG